MGMGINLENFPGKCVPLSVNKIQQNVYPSSSFTVSIIADLAFPIFVTFRLGVFFIQ